ncbi:hypothetical protein EON65_27305 [archaeon]|nr:MAG: hypothetical protein EON65_27305 [archaeon]
MVSLVLDNIFTAQDEGHRGGLDLLILLMEHHAQTFSTCAPKLLEAICMGYRQSSGYIREHSQVR